MRRIYKSPVLLFLLFFGLLSSAAIAATTISINSGGGIPLGSGRATVGVCDSDITMSASTSLDPTSGLMRVATISVGGLDMRYPEGCAGKVLDVAYLLNGTPTYASFNIPSIGLSNGTFVLGSPSNACNQANETLSPFSATTLSSVSISPNFGASYQSAANYSGTSIVSSNLVVNLNASNYSGSGNWSNTGTAGGVATPYLNPAYTAFGGGSCLTFTGTPSGSQRFRIANSTYYDMTIGVWFKTVVPGTGSSPYHFWDTSFLIDGDYPEYTSDFGLGITGGRIVWGIGNGNNSIYGDRDIERVSASTYNDGIWHYVTVTRNTTGALNIYVDGSLDTDPSSIQGTSGTGPLNQSNDLGIGGEKAGGRNYYGDKSIAAVHMYDRVLTSTEIAQNYNAMRSFFGR
ncbi:MAG: LamG-like jellyroll fold domain-containing protein [Actinomycetes bacterium]